MNGADAMGLAIFLLATLPFMLVTAMLVRQGRKSDHERPSLPEAQPRADRSLVWISGCLVAFVIFMAVAMWIAGQVIRRAVGGLL